MRLKRIIKLGLTNFWRNIWLSSAASFMLFLTLLVVGIFLTLGLFAQKTTLSIEKKIDLTVYFYDSTLDAEIQNISQQLLSRPEVQSLNFVSKEEALKIWRLRQRTSPRLRDLVTKEENPLPRSLQIKTKQPEMLKDIAQFLASDKYKAQIRRISYEENKNTVDRLIKITKMVNKFGWSLSLVFILISILVVYNTIRLTIFSRKEEIEIMRLVGAADIFIRLPFMIESMLYGLIAVLASIIIITIAILTASPAVSSYLGDLNLNIANFYFSRLWLLIGVELAVGIAISIICSLVAIKKYLRI